MCTHWRCDLFLNYWVKRNHLQTFKVYYLFQFRMKNSMNEYWLVVTQMMTMTICHRWSANSTWHAITRPWKQPKIYIKCQPRWKSIINSDRRKDKMKENNEMMSIMPTENDVTKDERKWKKIMKWWVLCRPEMMWLKMNTFFPTYFKISTRVRGHAHHQQSWIRFPLLRERHLNVYGFSLYLFYRIYLL